MSRHDDELIEDYLDHIVAPLVGIVPYGRRMLLRGEMRLHVEMLMEDGQTASASLLELGDPWDVGARFLQEWEEQAKVSGAAKFARSGFAAALGWFGTPFAAILLLTEEAALLPAHVGLVSLANQLMVAAPIVAGAVVGLGHPARAAKSSAQACAALAVYGALCALTTGPRLELLDVAVRTLLFWTTTGAVVAQLSSSYFRNLRRRRLWRGLQPQAGGLPAEFVVISRGLQGRKQA